MYLITEVDVVLYGNGPVRLASCETLYSRTHNLTKSYGNVLRKEQCSSIRFSDSQKESSRFDIQYLFIEVNEASHDAVVGCLIGMVLISVNSRSNRIKLL